MANPYAQAAAIAAPYTALGQQMFQGANMREAGLQKQALNNAQRGAFEGHANLYNAQAQKAQEEAGTIAQRRQYMTPEFANGIAASLNGLAPELGDRIARGDTDHGLTPEQMQRFNQARGAQLLSLGSTKESDSETTMKVISSLFGRNDYDASKASPAAALSYAQSQYAQKGGAPFHQGANGVMNVITGQENLNAVGNSAAQENRAQANNANASAAQHIASRDLTRSKIGQSQTVTMPDGTVVSTGAAMPKLTEIQAKSQLFGSRAAESDRIISSLEGKYSPAAINAKMGAEGIWGVGGALGAAGNAMLSKEGQMAEQAQRDFINAVLRLESGAVIGESEFANAKKQYFPQPGDNKEVLNQKKANRRMAIEGLKVMAGPASGLVNYGGKQQEKSSALAEAKAAIEAGAPRDLVVKRLKEMGVDGGGI